MNGLYQVATGGKGPMPASAWNSDYASKGHKFFDVWAPEIATHYGEVFWTDQHNQPLPQAIVDEFKGKTIALTGYEMDQVMVTPQGKPGQEPEKDVSVPINWAYNHHYMAWMTSAEYTELVTVDALPGDVLAHGASRKNVIRDVIGAPTPAPPTPTSQMFSEGNGGESRKSFHGYPDGYAQLLFSPTTWHITPMQIDTRNRDCGANATDIHKCIQFTPGPEPKQARYGLGVDPKVGTNYSGVLECPCNSRFGGDPHIYGDAIGKVTKPVHHQFEAVTGTDACAKGATIQTSAEMCFSAVAAIHVNNIVANRTVDQGDSLPVGCSVAVSTSISEDHAVTAYFNAAASSTGTCGSAKQHVTQARSLIGVTFAATLDATKGGDMMVPYGNKAYYCSKNRENILSTHKMKANNIQAAQAASDACNAACMANEKCNACSIDCPAGDTSYPCQWQAIPKCGDVLKWGAGWDEGWIPADISQKKIGGEATITLSGPADVWFGVGLDAQIMSDAPYTLIVNDTGVSERQIGTCGSEAEHCPGDVLSASITLKSNSVSDGRRTVVLTRPMIGASEKHYTFSPVSQSTVNFITAIGNTQMFAYHKAHMPSVMTFVAADGSAMCVCDQGAMTEMCDSSGAECDRFVKNCVKAPDGSLLEQNNPTCTSKTYGGGLSCCHHGRIMLDADQEIRPELLRYHMKFRFWYEEYVPASADGKTPASHRNLQRVYQQTEADAGEYDIPPAFAKPGFPVPGYPGWPANKPTPGTTCTGTCPDGPDCECFHEIHFKWNVGTEQEAHVPLNTTDNAMYLIYAGGHCHAPSCLGIELYRNDTGEKLCSQEPIYGKGDVLHNKWDEADYVTLPPCLWGHDEGLAKPVRLPIGTPLLSIKRNKNTHFGHFGEMASWQMRAVYGAEAAGQHAGKYQATETAGLLMNRWGSGFTCAMCKKLVPYLKDHECKSKCSALWPFLRGTCEELCGELIKYAPAVACWSAGYCPKPVV
jgi:hypothetical protein